LFVLCLATHTTDAGAFNAFLAALAKVLAVATAGTIIVLGAFFALLTGAIRTTGFTLSVCKLCSWE
jgi:hypothetical protein